MNARLGGEVDEMQVAWCAPESARTLLLYHNLAHSVISINRPLDLFALFFWVGELNI